VFRAFVCQTVERIYRGANRGAEGSILSHSRRMANHYCTHGTSRSLTCLCLRNEETLIAFSFCWISKAKYYDIKVTTRMSYNN
jgi:hypothetical protein